MGQYSLNPENFLPTMNVVAVYLLVGQEILLLKRHPKKDYGGLWCAPGGKQEKGQTLLIAASEELRQETGLTKITLEHRHSFNVRYPEYDFTYDTYLARLVKKPRIQLKEDEHTDFQWVNIADYATVQTVPLEKEGLRLSLPKELAANLTR